MINCKNTEAFEAWLKNVCKTYHGNLDVYLDELAEQHGINGSYSYEISGLYTKSGNPECYSFEVECEYDEDGEYVDETYIL